MKNLTLHDLKKAFGKPSPGYTMRIIDFAPVAGDTRYAVLGYTRPKDSYHDPAWGTSHYWVIYFTFNEMDNPQGEKIRWFDTQAEAEVELASRSGDRRVAKKAALGRLGEDVSRLLGEAGVLTSEEILHTRFMDTDSIVPSTRRLVGEIIRSALIASNPAPMASTYQRYCVLGVLGMTAWACGLTSTPFVTGVIGMCVTA